MKDKKYVVIIKRSIVALVILFVIVCFSFGVTYSNFVYNSNDHRAVEMHVSKLMYGIKINNNSISEISVKPGISRLSIEIESLNEIVSYYKLLVNSNNYLNVYYLDNESSGKLEKNEKTNVSLIVFNSSNSNINVKFLINGGYVTNNISDIRIDEGYEEINKLSVGDYISYNTENIYIVNDDYSTIPNTSISNLDNSFRILSINDDNTIDIISDRGIVLNDFRFLGSNGYNNFNYIINELLNSLYYSENTTSIKNIDIVDLEKYSNGNIIKNNNLVNLNKELYIPSVLELENNVIVNGNMGSQTSSDVIMIDKLNSYKLVDSLGIVTNSINDIIFNNQIYKELLMNDSYYLSTRMYNYDEENGILSYGIYNINDNNLSFNKLYDSNNEEYEITNIAVRPIIKLSNTAKIRFSNNKLEVK